MEKFDEKELIRLYTVVLSTYLNVTPPQVTRALQDLQKRSGFTFKTGKSIFFISLFYTAYIFSFVLSSISAGFDEKNLKKSWIEYVGLLVPSENLFREALGVYDLSLALDIAHITSQVCLISIIFILNYL